MAPHIPKKLWVIIVTLFLLGGLLITIILVKQQQDIRQRAATQVGIWDRFEGSVTNTKTYTNPYVDVTLNVTYTKPNGTKVNFWGFYDDSSTWRFRFMPDMLGTWSYNASFSDGTPGTSGTFDVVNSTIPGMLSKDETNPIWFGYKGGTHGLVKSFHVGDRFFASNFSATTRTNFLNWAQSQGYNMLSVASHYLNRNVAGRGQGWSTPDLWVSSTGRPNALEYQKLEAILNDLANRKMMVYPFAGFFGQSSDFPTNQALQEVYIRYTLARLGVYWNVLLNVSGPEPLAYPTLLQNAMTETDINRLGTLMSQLDVYGHPRSVHNGTNLDPFTNQSWYSYSTSQGPKTTTRTTLSSGLLGKHHASKPLYAQETLWSGNKNHPNYSDTDLRKNAWVIMMSASALNFADNDPNLSDGNTGDSSAGFSGSMDLTQRVQSRHDIIRKVWDTFDDFEFWPMKPSQSLVSTGFALADPGRDYLVYLDTTRAVTVTITGGPYNVTWINVQTGARTTRPQISSTQALTPPTGGDDWLLHLSTGASPLPTATPTQPPTTGTPQVVAQGSFPDLAVDASGNIHLVYARSGILYYKKWTASTKVWSNEESTGVAKGTSVDDVNRSDPDVVVDTSGNPHVFAWTTYARKTTGSWQSIAPGVTRDTELAIDSTNVIWIVDRGGNNGGHIGVKKLTPGASSFVSVTDPDTGNVGTNTDHVYGDIATSPIDNSLHVVYRHATPQAVSYRFSTNGGSSWSTEGISNTEPEAPHIVVDYTGKVFVTNGDGIFYRRNGANSWSSEGIVVAAGNRDQPELGVDKSNNVYVTSFGGRYNVRRSNGTWVGAKTIASVSGQSIGFVESAGINNTAYLTWFEATGVDNDLWVGTGNIIVGQVDTNGTVTGIGGATGPTPTSGPSSSPTPTRTPTPLPPTITPSVTLTPTAVPTSTPFPSPTLTETRKLSLTLLLHGVGKGGNAQNPNDPGNMTPVTPQRNVGVELHGGSPTGSVAGVLTGSVLFDPVLGNFTGMLPFPPPGSIPDGAYYVRIKTERYVGATAPTYITLSPANESGIVPVGVTTMVVGDSNGDDSLDILDYNIFADCVSIVAPPRACPTPEKKTSADLNDDGVVDGFDYNLFIVELLGRQAA